MLRRGPLLTFALGGLLAVAGCTPTTSPATTSPVTTSPAATANPAVTNTPSASTAAGTPATTTTTLLVRDFSLDPGTLSVSGTSLALAVTNQGPTVHNVKVRDAAGTVLFGTKNLREGQSETITHDIAPGSYVLFCSLPGHESLGIKGTLTVAAP